MEWGVIVSSYQELIDREKAFVSQKIPQTEKKEHGFSILQEVACMSPKERKIYGYIVALNEIRKRKKHDPSRLTKYLRPLQVLGLSQKVFSELSELGFKLGQEEGMEILDLESLGIIKS